MSLQTRNRQTYYVPCRRAVIRSEVIWFQLRMSRNGWEEEEEHEGGTNNSRWKGCLSDFGKAKFKRENYLILSKLWLCIILNYNSAHSSQQHQQQWTLLYLDANAIREMWIQITQLLHPASFKLIHTFTENSNLFPFTQLFHQNISLFI